MADEKVQAGTKPKFRNEMHKIYDPDKARTLMKGIKLAECMKINPSVRGQNIEQESNVGDVPKLPELSVSDILFCSFCNARFDDKNEQRQHYKLDWHRYNLKQKLFGKKFVSEEEFSRLADGVSSISGSETEDCDDSESSTSSPHRSPRRLSGQTAKVTPIQNKVLQKIRSNYSSTDTEDESGGLGERLNKVSRHSKVFFENEAGSVISIYKCILFQNKNIPPCDKQLISLAVQCPSHTNWAIIMVGGGHFAAGIFKGKEVVAHKTFHCYTVRAKQGGSQSSRDGKNANSHPKSAGASLRRYNEASLMQHVQEIMENWSDYLEKSDIIFYRAVGNNKKTLFGGKNPLLKKTDARLRSVPFPTRRATFSEVQRVHDVLTTVEVHGSAERFRSTFPPPRPHHKKSKPPTSSEAVAGSDRKDEEGIKLVDAFVLPSCENSTLSANMSSDDNVGRSPRKSNPRKMDRAKPRPSPNRLLPGIVRELARSSSTDSSEGEDEVLVKIFEKVNTHSINGMDVSPMVEGISVINFCDDLCEFEDTIPRTIKERVRHGMKKKEHKKNKRETKQPLSEGEEKISVLRNNLYTACKLGDEALLNIAVASCESAKESLECETKQSHGSSTTENINSADGAEALQNSTLISLESTKETSVSLEGETQESHGPSTTENMNSADASPVTINAAVLLSCLNEKSHEADNNTLLHVASSLEHNAIIKILMERGADPALRNKRGKTPYNVAPSKETRNVFRKFMAEWPDRYNYKKAQIPGPLTDDMEQAEAEKRKLQRKAKKEREKEKKKQEQERKKEEEERQRFLSLSDREKRALAAERRFLSQVQSKGNNTTVLSRCFLCGIDITGKVPFEYNYFRFCTTACLKTHRIQNKPS